NGWKDLAAVKRTRPRNRIEERTWLLYEHSRGTSHVRTALDSPRAESYGESTGSGTRRATKAGHHWPYWTQVSCRVGRGVGTAADVRAVAPGPRARSTAF